MMQNHGSIEAIASVDGLTLSERGIPLCTRERLAKGAHVDVGLPFPSCSLCKISTYSPHILRLHFFSFSDILS
jgi:hypothetical protein